MNHSEIPYVVPFNPTIRPNYSTKTGLKYSKICDKLQIRMLKYKKFSPIEHIHK